MDLYVRVEWPECQYYMDCDDIIHVEDSQDLMISFEEYKLVNEIKALKALQKELNK